MKMELNEAIKTLENAGLIVEDQIPDNVMELALEVLHHSFYDLDMDVYALAEMGEDWLKDYLQELNDKEMRFACM